MNALVGILSFLSVLAATSYALSCIQCRSATLSCSGIAMTCPPGYVCGSTYTASVIEGEIKIESLTRRCMPPTECGFKGSMTLRKRRREKMATSCCSDDDCSPTVPVLPTQSSEPNGLVCQSCSSVDSTWCYTSKTVQCTGDENACVLRVKKSTGSILTIKGCATSSFCYLGSQSYSMNGESTDFTFICNGGGIHVPNVVLTRAIVGLLLLKFFS